MYIKYGLLPSYKNLKSVLQKKEKNLYRCKSIPYWFLITTVKRKAEDISYDLILILSAYHCLMYIKWLLQNETDTSNSQRHLNDLKKCLQKVHFAVFCCLGTRQITNVFLCWFSPIGLGIPTFHGRRWCESPWVAHTSHAVQDSFLPEDLQGGISHSHNRYVTPRNRVCLLLWVVLAALKSKR